ALTPEMSWVRIPLPESHRPGRRAAHLPSCNLGDAGSSPALASHGAVAEHGPSAGLKPRRPRFDPWPPHSRHLADVLGTGRQARLRPVWEQSRGSSTLPVRTERPSPRDRVAGNRPALHAALRGFNSLRFHHLPP